MTISTSQSSILCAGNGSQTAFQFPFAYDSSTVMNVYYIDANNVMTLLASNTYGLVLNAPATNQLWGVGGTVTYPLSGSPIAAGTYLLISRLVPYQQNISIQNQGNFAPQTIEQALDLLEMQIQQNAARTTQFRGVWKTNTTYYVGDIVQDGTNGSNTTNYYICQVANTSGTWSTDLAAGDWAISVLATVPSGITLPISVTNGGLGANNSGATGITQFSSGAVSITTALANGTTATTQSPGDNTTKVATTAFVIANAGAVSSFTGDGTVLSNSASTGAVTASLATQTTHKVLAGPTSGGAVAPTFRNLVIGDLPGFSPITNSLSGDVSLTDITLYFDGPSVAQGSTGTWYASGTVTLSDSSSSSVVDIKLWDGTTVIASTQVEATATTDPLCVALSGFLASPAGNLRMSVKNTTDTTGKIRFNLSGNSKDSTITAFRLA